MTSPSSIGQPATPLNANTQRPQRPPVRKQAVLLIHGIGEQRPMDSLRRFVETVWTTDTDRHRPHGDDRDGVWSKPYGIDENFELRRLTTAANRAGVRTDFFEFYWAHLMSGTRVGHVVAWAKTLLLRNPGTVPRQLRLAYWTLWVLVVFGLYMGYRAAVAKATGAEGLPVWANLIVSLAVVPFIIGILTRTVGDAARYLHVAPANVQRRHEIRAAGIKVLKSLHERRNDRGEPDYDRIIVVGHSLGSVIGYDVLNHAWAEFHDDKPAAGAPTYEALTALESLVASGGGKDLNAVEYQRAQRRYLDELRANQTRWRVTDFITLGSPLAHAEILLAEDVTRLRPKFEDREFPRCPPVLEESQHNHQILRRFSFPASAAVRSPHHAAVFAPVRWTNLYFPNRLLLWGDLIGGPLSPMFGPGIRDIPVRTSLWGGLFSHTRYWTRETGSGANAHVTALREALDLLDANA